MQEQKEKPYPLQKCISSQKNKSNHLETLDTKIKFVISLTLQELRPKLGNYCNRTSKKVKKPIFREKKEIKRHFLSINKKIF